MRNPARKLRSDSRWHQFTPAEREHIRHMLDEGCPLDQVSAYCAAIKKPWAQSRISEFFTPERKAVLDEEANIRRETLTLNMLMDAARAGGMELDELAAKKLAQKLQGVIGVAQADPRTPEGRDLILKTAPSIIGLRSVNLDQLKAKGRYKQKAEEIELSRDKFQFNAAKAVLAHAKELRAIATDRSLDDDAKIQRIRARVFGQLPEEAARE